MIEIIRQAIARECAAGNAEAADILIGLISDLLAINDRYAQ